MLNNNPLQNVPIEISECRSLKVLDLSHTFVKILPREMGYLKELYVLNLEACPLEGEIKEVYPKGILAVLAHFKYKLDRAFYRVQRDSPRKR